MTWLMGSLTDRNWDHVWLAGPFVLLGAALLLATMRDLDALSPASGRRKARHQRASHPVARTFGTALGVGAATAVTGSIGFVGLIAPHLVRPLVGHRPGATLIPAALVGAAIVLAADIATRSLRFGPDIKLGVCISMVGAPFFLWLVLHVRKTAP